MDIVERLLEVPTMGHDAGCVVEAAEEIKRLRSALRGMLALDEENHQRVGCDDDVCFEVRTAYAALVPNVELRGGPLAARPVEPKAERT